jgi:hypothetical protein
VDAKDIEHLSPLIITKFAPIRMPRSADHIHNRATILLAGRREDIHQEANAVSFGEHNVRFLLIVAYRLGGTTRSDRKSRP